MSNDKQLETMKICHELGACFFVIKPLDVNTAKNLWQHIIFSACFQREKFEGEIRESTSKRAPQISDAILNDQTERKKNHEGKNVLIANTASQCDSLNLENTMEMQISKSSEGKKGEGREQITRKDDENSRKARTRRVWDEYLEQKFRVANETLGRDAVPSKIMKHMNIEGITRRQVASHLQKYRLKEKNRPFSPSIPVMFGPGTEMARFKQVSNQYGLFTTQGHLNCVTLKPSVPVTQMLPFGMQLPPNYNSYPNLSSMQSCKDNSLLHQTKNVSQNQLASHFGMAAEIPSLHSTSALPTNMNNFMGFGAVIPCSFEAAIQTQQLNPDVQFSSSFREITQMQQFDCGTQVSESFREIHQPQLLNDVDELSDSSGNLVSEYTDVGLVGNDSKDIDATQYKANKQHTHLVSEIIMTADAYVDGAAMKANQFSITDSEQQHNGCEENTLLVSEYTRNDLTTNGEVINANQVNNFEQQYAGSHVVENSSKVVEEEDLNHSTEDFACGDDSGLLMPEDSFEFDFI
ncbi:two-component response regulator ORR24-like [Cocos nucifera]|nr:two-component response regulator ORR24-like [Cocos nucifera]